MLNQGLKKEEQIWLKWFFFKPDSDFWVFWHVTSVGLFSPTILVPMLSLFNS